jgi:hypothetical protein
MGLWDRVKDWFCDTRKAEALNALFDFFHGSKGEKFESFERLASLASDPYRDRFTKTFGPVESDGGELTLEIDVGNMKFIQKATVTTNVVVDYLVKNYGDFFLAPIKDQKGFRDFFKGEATIPTNHQQPTTNNQKYLFPKNKLVHLMDFSSGLHKVLDEWTDDEVVFEKPIWKAMWMQRRFSTVLANNPKVMNYILKNQNHAAIIEWRAAHPLQVSKSQAPHNAYQPPSLY